MGSILRFANSSVLKRRKIKIFKILITLVAFSPWTVLKGDNLNILCRVLLSNFCIVFYIYCFCVFLLPKRAYPVHGDTPQMAIRLRAKMFFLTSDDKILILDRFGI